MDSKSKKDVKKFEFEDKGKNITKKKTNSKFEFGEAPKKKKIVNDVIEKEKKKDDIEKAKPDNTKDEFDDKTRVKLEKKEDKLIEKTKTIIIIENIKFTRIYFSFEARVAIMMLVVLVLFGCACFFSLEAINFGKNEIVPYDEVGKVNYNVCLKPNDTYKQSCIDDKESVNEYVSDMIDTISASFYYNVEFSTDIEYELYYHVAAVTKIYDVNDQSRILYQSNENIIDKTSIKNNSRYIKFNDSVAIRYSDYNDFVSNYLNEYSLQSSSAVVDLILYLDEPTETRAVATLSIPLGAKTFGITKSSITNTNKSVEIVNDTWNEYNTLCAFLATVLIVISLSILFKTTRLVLKVTGNKNKYQAKIQEILREYDRIIVIARDGYETNVERNVIKVDSFEKLLAAHETLKKPIIFSKVNDVKCEFIVEDNKTLYKYVLKEADL